jgi:hypothetical protein
MSVETPRKKTGRGYERNLNADVLQPMVSSFELHLRAEKKSPKTIRTYVEAAQWMAAEYLVPGGITDWADVRARHVNEWTIWLLGQYSDCYASNQFRALQQFFKWHATEDPEPGRDPQGQGRASQPGLAHRPSRPRNLRRPRRTGRGQLTTKGCSLAMRPAS